MVNKRKRRNEKMKNKEQYFMESIIDKTLREKALNEIAKEMYNILYQVSWRDTWTMGMMYASLCGKMDIYFSLGAISYDELNDIRSYIFSQIEKRGPEGYHAKTQKLFPTFRKLKISGLEY
jgi:hypothetical protein